jgi:hypothetical protein
MLIQILILAALFITGGIIGYYAGMKL